jgi:hypothetical protein
MGACPYYKASRITWGALLASWSDYHRLAARAPLFCFQYQEYKDVRRHGSGSTPNPRRARQAASGTPQDAHPEAALRRWRRRARKPPTTGANCARLKQVDGGQKAEADAAEKQAKEQGKFAELYEAEKANRAAEAVAQLQRLQHDAARKEAAQAAGIAQLWQRLQGETAEELAEDAKTLAAFVAPPAPAPNGQPARVGTPPTPQAQGKHGLTDEERRARAARTF